MIRKDHLLEFIEQLDEVFFIMDYPSLEYKYISPSVLSRGYTQEEVYENPDTMLQQFSPEQQKAFLELVERNLGKGPITTEYPVLTKSGKTIWYQSTFLLLHEPDGRQSLVGMGRDVSYWKNAELEIEKLKLEYEDLYNNAPNGYHSLDTEGVIVRVNDTELDWLGYKREEMMGKNVQEVFLTPDSQRKFAKIYPMLKANGFAKDVKIELLRKDGSTLHALLNASTEKDEQGSLVYTRSIFTDITALSEAEEKLKKSKIALESINSELKHANQKLERLNFTKDVLLRIISHDLRNPLETIKLLSGLLNEKYDELDP
ncbi:MAG: PAS domain S-box protein [Saprospiraceae bacterium]|nr:PAS domain S-box protein [Saprospiraceae bacterium]